MYLQLYDEKQLDDLYAEFGATHESVRRDVQHLKEWLEKQPHLPNVTDEEFLSNFLIRCKNSVERAKNQLEVYYTNRAAMPEIFTNRDPCSAEIQKCVNLCMYISLPKLTPQGHRITIFRIFKHAKDSMPRGEEFIKAVQMLMDVSLKKDRVKGLIVVYDFQNLDMTFVTLILSQLKKLMQLSTKATPIRYHKIYILNITPAAEQIVSVCKSVVKKELADRVEIWKKPISSLSEILPKECLPSTYGGHLQPIEQLRDEWFEYIKSYREWFRSEENVKADLGKISKDSRLAKDVSNYGLEGSFRKMDFD